MAASTFVPPAGAEAVLRVLASLSNGDGAAAREELARVREDLQERQRLVSAATGEDSIAQSALDSTDSLDALLAMHAGALQAGLAALQGVPLPGAVLAGADHGDEEAMWHGMLGAREAWPAPRNVAATDDAARPGYRAYTASEYLDSPKVLAEKAALLADMWRRSGQDTVIYTGAGLSTASGIGDYASKAKGSVAPHKAKGTKGGSRLDLQPTFAHHALAAIEEKKLLGNWVQQNHDRLAQKAGYPQKKLNEIHGAWGDMKNQVKMMDDTLRADLLEWLVAWSDRAKLCVALGTSLCGMNADRVPDAVAERFKQGQGEGLVIIGLQRTAYDDMASLRIWGLCDDVMAAVAKELQCKVPNPKAAQRGAAWTSKHPRLSYNTPARTAKDPM